MEWRKELADIPLSEPVNDLYMFNQTNAGIVCRATLQGLLRDGRSAYGPFRALRCDLERQLTTGRVSQRPASEIGARNARVLSISLTPDTNRAHRCWRILVDLTRLWSQHPPGFASLYETKSLFIHPLSACPLSSPPPPPSPHHRTKHSRRVVGAMRRRQTLGADRLQAASLPLYDGEGCTVHEQQVCSPF